jgi:hypothetical protein
MEVAQHNMANDIIGEGKLEGGFLVLKGIDMVELVDDIGNQISGEESVVGVVDFGQFDDDLFGELVEASG